MPSYMCVKGGTLYVCNSAQMLVFLGRRWIFTVTSQQYKRKENADMISYHHVALQRVL